MFDGNTDMSSSDGYSYDKQNLDIEDEKNKGKEKEKGKRNKSKNEVKTNDLNQNSKDKYSPKLKLKNLENQINQKNNIGLHNHFDINTHQSNKLHSNNHEIIDKKHQQENNVESEGLYTDRNDETFSCNKTSFLFNQSSDNSFDRESLIKIFDKFNEII